MLLKSNRSVEKSIVSTTITVESFGSDVMTSEMERQCVNDWKIEIDYGKLLFSRYVKMDDGGQLVIVDESEAVTKDEETGEITEVNADKVTLSMDSETVIVDENLEIKFAVDANDLKSRVGMYKYLRNQYDIAKAMILVFETVVADKISEELEINKQHLDDFEEEKIIVV